MEIIIAQNTSITATTSAVARPTFASYTTSTATSTTTTISKTSTTTSTQATSSISTTTSATIPQTAFWDNSKEFMSFFMTFSGIFLIILSLVIIQYRKSRQGFEDKF